MYVATMIYIETTALSKINHGGGET